MNEDVLNQREEENATTMSRQDEHPEFYDSEGYLIPPVMLPDNVNRRVKSTHLRGETGKRRTTVEINAISAEGEELKLVGSFNPDSMEHYNELLTKCNVESDLKAILVADDMLLLDFDGGVFHLHYQYDAPISSDTVSTGSTLTELIQNYKARDPVAAGYAMMQKMGM